MKATCLFFLMITCAALTPGTACADLSRPAFQQTSSESAANTVSDHPHDVEHAAPADDGKREKNGKPFDEREVRRHDFGKNHPRSPATKTKDRPKTLPNNSKRFVFGNAMNLYQPGSDKSTGVARSGLIQQETVNRALPVRPANVIRPTIQSPPNVRHRGPNPAAVGGLASRDSRNTGAINGTRMQRRP
jgi:hypothetical protein